MKGKTIWIVVGLLVVGLIAFFMWRSSQRRKADQLALQQQQMLMQGGMNNQFGNQNQGNLSGTLDSVGGVVDSLSGLFGQFGWGGGSSAVNEQALVDQYTTQCEMMFNTNEEVSQCIQAKLNQST